MVRLLSKHSLIVEAVIMEFHPGFTEIKVLTLWRFCHQSWIEKLKQRDSTKINISFAKSTVKGITVLLNKKTLCKKTLKNSYFYSPEISGRAIREILLPAV